MRALLALSLLVAPAAAVAQTATPVVSTSLLGLVVSPFANAASGLSVWGVARQ